MVSVRKKRVQTRALAWTAVILACAVLGTFAVLNFGNAVSEINSFAGQLLAKLHPGGAIENSLWPDEMARIDSVLALQRSMQRAATGAQQKQFDSLAADSLFDMNDKTVTVTAAFPLRKARPADARMSPAGAQKPAARVPAPAPEAAQTVTPQQLVERLKQLLHTSDLMAMFSSEIEAGNFVSGLMLYGMLAPAQAHSKKAMLYRLRALRATGDRDGAKSLLFGNDIKDGEFYLEKARFYYVAKDYRTASQFVQRASVSPAQFMDSRTFRETLLYSKALCASAFYDASQTAATRKEAMEAWYDVKSLFKMSPEHKYFVKADSELRRISSGLLTKK